MDEAAAREDLGRATRTVKSLLNNELKTICKSEGLPVTGVKAVLQRRIIDRLEDLQGSGDLVRFRELCRRLRPNHAVASHSNQHAPSTYGNSGTSHLPNGFHGSSMSTSMSKYGMTPSTLTFPDSPFYSIVQSLSKVIEMPVASSTRSIAQIPLTLSQHHADSLRADSNLRILLYCSGNPYGPQPNDIAFPAQVEVKVNGENYTGNTRGIKKKPGTTRPADITPFIKKQSMYNNIISVTYAATDKKFAYIINLARRHPVDELVNRIKQGHVISKQQVLNEMISKARDPDIVATSTVMSLRCPISAMRMQLPCRSTVCSHTQCFDAASFLQAQEQAPQWTCPTCSKKFAFEALVIDQYVQDILNSTSTSVDQVTIEPDGKWRPGASTDDFRRPDASSKSKQFDIASDDLLEISEPRSIAVKNEAPLTPLSFTRPSNFSSREPSASISGAPRSSTAGSNKRPAGEVIDLTLSDDEDGPPRPVKRQSTGNVHSLLNNSPYIGMVQDQSTYEGAYSRPHSFSFNMSQRSGPTPNSMSPYPGYGLPGRRF